MHEGEVEKDFEERGNTAFLLEALFLVGSFVVFYQFACFAAPVASSSPSSKASSSLPGQSSGESCSGTLSLAGAGRAFSCTFSLSCCIFELIVLEVAGLLNPVSSSFAWRVCLYAMVVALHVILPFLLAYAWLGELGFDRRSSSRGALILLCLALFSASRLGRLDAVGHATHDTGLGGAHLPPSMFSLEAGLVRIGTVGVASLALLSGFGAVNLPYQQLATLLRRVPMRLVRSRERRARLTLEDIGQRKRRAAIARATATYPGNDGVATSWGPRGQRRPSRSSTMSWVLRVFAPATASDQAERAAEAETASLEKIAQELFVDIADCRRIMEQQRRARTPTGRVLVAFGAVMFAYCLLRLWKAGVTVLWKTHAYGTSAGGGFSSGGGVAVGEGGTGVGDDPATRLVRFALSRHLVLDDDAEGWSELISFLLIGILVLMQTRGFLLTITAVSRASTISGLFMPAQVLSLLLSMLMGTYFTSSVILMRVNLPQRHRVAITTVLGGMRFGFYQRWFDTVFLVSGCVTSVTLLALHIADRNSDADDSDRQRHRPSLDKEEETVGDMEAFSDIGRTGIRPRGRGGLLPGQSVGFSAWTAGDQRASKKHS